MSFPGKTFTSFLFILLLRSFPFLYINVLSWKNFYIFSVFTFPSNLFLSFPDFAVLFTFPSKLFLSFTFPSILFLFFPDFMGVFSFPSNPFLNTLLCFFLLVRLLLFRTSTPLALSIVSLVSLGSSSSQSFLLLVLFLLSSNSTTLDLLIISFVSLAFLTSLECFIFFTISVPLDLPIILLQLLLSSLNSTTLNLSLSTL